MSRVNLNSPFHQQACVFATTVVGGAAGALMTAGNPLGTLGGFAVGAIIGLYVCPTEPLDRWFEDHMSFEKALQGFGADTRRYEQAIERLAQHPLVRDRATAEVLIVHSIAQARRDPQRCLAQAVEQRRSARADGRAVHGLAVFGNMSRDAWRRVA